jgi:nucleotide-binding universal stress UspA family protein
MIEKIVVPLDGSVTAEAVLPHVRRLLRLEDAEAVFVRAENPAPVENYMPVAEAALAAAREYIAGIQERFAREGARVKSVARLGAPASVILDVVRQEKATLVALATHGRTGLRRILFGSVAEQVLRKSPIPVLAVRPFWSYEVVRPEPGIRNILVPLDGSMTSRAVLDPAADLARLCEARIVLLHALDPKERRTREDRAKERDAALAYLKEAEGDLAKRGVASLSLVDDGAAAKLILDAARAHEADLIAMTTHGRAGLSRMIAGSVTEEVLRKATVPLLVVRAQVRKAKKKAPVTGKEKR